MNYVKFQIDKTAKSPLCRMCRVEIQAVPIIVSECEMLAEQNYKKSHSNVCKYIQWRLCEKHGFEVVQQWHEHEPDVVIENVRYRFLWDFTIQCDTKIEAQ